LIGYGNPGRLDDGLGPRLAEAIAAHEIDGVAVECNYQLNVEDAAEIAEHDVVIFADAHVSCADPFVFASIEPARTISFTTHSIDAASLLSLAEETFGGAPRGFALGMRGHDFNEFGEELSPKAEANLHAAIEFLLPLLIEPNLNRFRAAAEARGAQAACETTVT
jgi:hydrogenase maturation protease